MIPLTLHLPQLPLCELGSYVHRHAWFLLPRAALILSATKALRLHLPTGSPASCQLPSWDFMPLLPPSPTCWGNQLLRLLAGFKRSSALQYFKIKLEFEVLRVPQG